MHAKVCSSGMLSDEICILVSMYMSHVLVLACAYCVALFRPFLSNCMLANIYGYMHVKYLRMIVG